MCFESTHAKFASGQAKSTLDADNQRLVIPRDDGQQGVATDGEFTYVKTPSNFLSTGLTGSSYWSGLG